MLLGPTLNPNTSEGISLPASYLEKRWYAAYTRANHEKHVAKELQAREVEHFLPTYHSIRRWKDRRVRLELPLFQGYVFVRLALCEKLRVLQVPSIVHFVGFNGQPVPLHEQEMQTLRAGLTEKLQAEPHPYLTAGRRVRVKSGPLAGLEGILVRRKGKSRVVLSLDAIMRSIVTDLDLLDIEPLFQGKSSRGFRNSQAA
jgi:transcription antitermination factor NusG